MMSHLSRPGAASGPVHSSGIILLIASIWIMPPNAAPFSNVYDNPLVVALTMVFFLIASLLVHPRNRIEELLPNKWLVARTAVTA